MTTIRMTDLLAESVTDNFINEYTLIGRTLVTKLFEECYGISGERIISEGVWGSTKNAMSFLTQHSKEIFKGIDNKIEKIGNRLQNTPPVQNADKRFEEYKNKLRTTLSRSNNQLGQTALKYLDGISNLVKQHPKLSMMALGLLAAATGVASGPLGFGLVGYSSMPLFSAAMAGVMKSSFEVLKGSKLSTAVGKGVKVGTYTFFAGKAISGIVNAIAHGAAA